MLHLVSSSTENSDRNRLNSLNENKQVRVNILNMLFNKLIFFFFVFFLLVSASLFPTSIAGRPINQPAQKPAKDVVSALEEIPSRDEGEFSSHQREIESTIHERVLRVNTKDYGRYDPAPTLVKPPFKLIPN